MNIKHCLTACAKAAPLALVALVFCQPKPAEALLPAEFSAHAFSDVAALDHDPGLAGQLGATSGSSSTMAHSLGDFAEPAVPGSKPSTLSLMLVAFGAVLATRWTFPRSRR
jgi:hypothetical protein